MDKKYKNRVTLITYFEKEDLNKVDMLMKKIKVPTCKVPYILDTEEERHRADTFPWHITIFIGNKERVPQILELIKKAKKQKIKLRFNDVILKQSPKNGSMSLLLTIEQNQEMIDLQNMFYHVFTEENGRNSSYKGKEGEQYDASKYTFHLTLDIDKDIKKVQDEYEIIKKEFKPFEVEFEKLMLFNDLGGSLIAISKMGEYPKTEYGKIGVVGRPQYSDDLVRGIIGVEALHAQLGENAVSIQSLNNDGYKNKNREGR